MKIITAINVDEDLVRKIDRIAKSEGRSRSNMIERLILQEIHRNSQENAPQTTTMPSKTIKEAQ